MGSKREPAGGRTIRGQLTRIVLIPSVCFLVLWAAVTGAGTFRAGALMFSVVGGREAATAADALAGELREERRLSQIHIGDTESEVGSVLHEQRGATDAAVGDVTDLATSLTSDDDEEVRRSAGALLDDWDTLTALRDGVDSGEATRSVALDGYTTLVEDLQLLTESLLRSLDTNESLSEMVLARELIAAREEYSRAEALLAGAIAAGDMNYQDTAHFTYLTASYRDTLARAESTMRGGIHRRYTDLVASAAWQRTQALSRKVVTRSPVERSATASPRWNSDVDVEGDDWQGAARGAAPALDSLVSAQVGLAVDTGWDAALWRIALSAAACALTLAAGTAAIVVATRSSRRLTGRLCHLREALARSDTRLPDLVDRARDGKRVDVAAELPHLSHGKDEIGQVADAFHSAQRTAVGAAVKEAEIRQGDNRVFLGIAYRNQTLVQRQLRILDEVEYDEEDPRTLEKLFRLDHLATRARRYADNLIILGGAHSARRRRRPLPLVDVLRASISETEDYGRVRLTSAPRVWLRGHAVADVVHLIAELVENATQFSPADAPVDVNCGPVPGGLAVDVEDRGLGMTEDGYAQARHTLAEAPEFDVMALPDEPRLGLFVVARLAARHSVTVRLCPSPYGGTRATVSLPESLVETASPEVDPALDRVPGQRSSDP